MGHDPATELWLVRHGQTEWARDGRHTSTTDIPLTDVGEADARALGARLGVERFDRVLTSPRARARETAVLAGYPDAVVDEDLAEWDYGELEGLTTPGIQAVIPDWTIWTHGAPGGESVKQVAARYDRFVASALATPGRYLCFGHGHGLRVLAMRWIGEPVALGGSFALDTASVSLLGWERERPAIIHWNG